MTQHDAAATAIVTRTHNRKGYSESPGRMTRNDGLAEAVRFYKNEGAAFSGWVIRSTGDRFSYSDPVPTKTEAVRLLLAWGSESR